jgi:hypothetical protein
MGVRVAGGDEPPYRIVDFGEFLLEEIWGDERNRSSSADKKKAAGKPAAS